jgi:hypothetical protein
MLDSLLDLVSFGGMFAIVMSMNSCFLDCECWFLPLCDVVLGCNFLFESPVLGLSSGKLDDAKCSRFTGRTKLNLFSQCSNIVINSSSNIICREMQNDMEMILIIHFDQLKKN